MKTNTCTSQRTRPDGTPSAVELARLVECVRGADRLLAEAVELAGRLAGSGVCEQVEGLPLEQFAGLAARMTGGDARFLVTAGQVLTDLPVTAGLFAAGKLGWGQVRAIVAATRGLSRAERGEVDGRVEATVAAYGPGVDAFDPDGLVWAVDAAVEELRAPSVERAERKRSQRGFLARQQCLDGWMRLYGEVDPLTAAVINNALDAKMGRPPAGSGQPHPGAGAGGAGPGGVEADGGSDGAAAGGGEAEAQPGAAQEPRRQPDGDAEAGAGQQPCADAEAGATRGDEPAAGDGSVPEPGGGTEPEPWSGRGVGRAAAEALAQVCAEWLGGGPGRAARPLLVAHVNVGRASTQPPGTIELNLRGPLPRIGAATLEQLARDADLRVALFDGARPLAVSTKTRLKDPSERTRWAVRARDRGCRFPGSPDPIGFSDLDHLRERANGGDHDPDNVAAISRRFHTLRHEHGWTLGLDASTGMLTATRGRRRFHSLPRGTGLARPAPPCAHCGRGDPPAPPGDPPQGDIPF